MQKTSQTCQLCKRTINRNFHLSTCCWRVLCQECVNHPKHDCHNIRTWVVEGNTEEEKVERCDRCEKGLQVWRCVDCGHSFCGQCDEVIHQYGKFRYHQRVGLEQQCHQSGAQHRITGETINITLGGQKNPPMYSYDHKKPNLHKLEQKQQIINLYLEGEQQRIVAKWDSLKQELYRRVTQICQQLKHRSSEIENQLMQRKKSEIYQLHKVYNSCKEIPMHHHNLKQLLQMHEKKNVPIFIKNKLFQLHHQLDNHISKDMKKPKLAHHYHLGELVWDIEECINRISFKNIIMKNTVHKQNKSKHYLAQTYQTPRMEVKTNSTLYFTPKPTTTKNITLLNSPIQNKKSIHQKKNTHDYSINHHQSVSGTKIQKIKSDVQLDKIVRIEEISPFELGARKIKRREKVTTTIKTNRKNV